MKKILFLLMATTLSVSVMAQGNSKGKSKSHKQEKKHEKKNGSYKHDRDDRDETNDDRRWDRNDDRRQDNQDGKYSKNTPAKVRDAFYRDYPNASNVSWTKSRGVWTARFGNGLFNNTASYRANGQRISGNGTIASRREGTQQQPQGTQQQPQGTQQRSTRVLDKVIKKKQ